MTFPWWLVAILTCKSFVTFRSARFPWESSIAQHACREVLSNWFGNLVTLVSNHIQNKNRDCGAITDTERLVKIMGCDPFNRPGFSP